MDVLSIYVPVVVHTRRGSAPAAKPLFGAQGSWTSRATLEQTLQALRGEIVRDYATQLRRDDHRALSGSVRFADLQLTRWQGSIALREGTLRCSMGLVRVPAFEGETCFVLDRPEIWFQVRRGQSFAARAAEVIGDYFRRIEKADPDGIPLSRRIEVSGRVWLEELTVQIPNWRVQTRAQEDWADLFAAKPFDGFFELLDRGECLDDLYPNDLRGCHGREGEAEALSRLLDAADRRPILLVGEQDAGKTALLRAALCRSIERKVAVEVEAYRKGRQRTFLLSPQRLIAGMMYVGQWEGRLRAIVEHAGQWEHTLVFENLLGLFQAGRSSRSDTCFADLLRPALARREFRFVAEITPEGLRVARERDRGLADLFHIVRVRPFTRPETLRMLVQLRRELEDTHALAIGADSLAAVCRYCEHYIPEAAFPGKAVRLMREAVRDRLGLGAEASGKVKSGEAAGEALDDGGCPEEDPLKAQLSRTVEHSDILRAFAARTGYRFDFLDRAARLTRRELVEKLAARVQGQPAAVRAAADAVLMARARLADPGRPLASLLLLGPTGVGKTETARAVAAVVFEDTERFLRFDLNEFSTPDSVPRLFGTFTNPDGLLAGAVRRQPACVLLLDEIEKAHPDVFDLLLQVLGEGRLTDAHGRPVSFQHVLIFMTSNLGVSEAEAGLGFGAGRRSGDAHFVKAAEAFFRPEFFNRIDRIVPFGLLAPAELEAIARRLLNQILSRHGIRRRQCLLDFAPGFAAAMAGEVGESRFGARALKRLVEARIVQPVADRLAAVRFDTPVLVRFSLPEERGEKNVAVEALQQCDASPDVYAPLLALVPAVRGELLGQYARKLRLRVTEVDVGKTDNEARHSDRQVAAWRVQDALADLIARLDEMAAAGRDDRRPVDVKSIRVSMTRIRTDESWTWGWPGRGLLREICRADDVDEFLRSLFNPTHGQGALEEWRTVMAQLSRLSVEVDALARGESIAAVPLRGRWIGWREERVVTWLWRTIAVVCGGDEDEHADLPALGAPAGAVLPCAGFGAGERAAVVEGRHLLFSPAGEVAMLEIVRAGPDRGPDAPLPVVSLIRVTRTGCQICFLRSGETFEARALDAGSARSAANSWLHLYPLARGLEEACVSSDG